MKELAEKFFGESAKGLDFGDGLVTGYAEVGGREVCVIGTCGGTYIGNAAALRLAGHVLGCIENHPCTPLIMLVDSAGQEPNRTAEMLGLAGYFGHLLECLQLARQNGHALVTVATGKAVGGAFLCYGMFADRIFALESASVGLMPIEAMSAVTKIPAPVLENLSRTMPALEFGAKPFALLGGVEAVWPDTENFSARLAEALATPSPEDNRAALGKERGGRKCALDVRERVLAESRDKAGSPAAR